MDLQQIAQTTAGFTGADLENLLNEAAINAAMDKRAFVRQEDIKKAFIKVGIGAEKKSRIISEKEKKITANHERGQASMCCRMWDRFIPFLLFPRDWEQQATPCRFLKRMRCSSQKEK